MELSKEELAFARRLRDAHEGEAPPHRYVQVALVSKGNLKKGLRRLEHIEKYEKELEFDNVTDVRRVCPSLRHWCGSVKLTSLSR